MVHVLQSELGMHFSMLMGLEETPEALMVHFRWKRLSNSEDSLQPLSNIYADAHQMVERLLKRKNTPPALVRKARAALAP